MCALCTLAQRHQRGRAGLASLSTTEQLTQTILFNSRSSSSDEKPAKQPSAPHPDSGRCEIDE